MRVDTAKLRRYHTKATARAIAENTALLSLEKLIANLFIYTDNSIAKLLIQKYESQLVISRTKPEEFKAGLHDFYRNTAEFIRKNDLQKEFLSFWYFVYSSLATKEHPSKEALECYFNILSQQFDYFTHPQYTVYGLTSNNKWLVRPTPYPNLEIPLLENYRTRNFDTNVLFRELRKLGLHINSVEDLDSAIANDHLLNNMFYVLSNFVNENNTNIYPKNLYLVAHGLNIPPPITSTSFYQDLLEEKHYFLPMKGVEGIFFRNSGEISKIYFQEIFAENRIILLYRILAENGKGFCGLYDNNIKLFYSPWSDTNNGLKYHQALENLVLLCYAHLTTDIEKVLIDENLPKGLLVNEDDPLSPLPCIKFLYNEEQSNSNARKKLEGFRLFDKKKYQEILVTINPHIRRLPVGAKASPEAIELAKTFHYVLRPGETFVRPFEKHTYMKK